MADNNVVFKVAADFDKAIKEWEQLRDKVATTTKEYEDAQKAIEDLKIAKGEFTGVAYKSKKAIDAEKEALRKSNAEYKKREKELNQLFKVQERNTKSVSKSTKQQKQQKDATGSVTSATMELSRVISDAPYGIRGMANNITQLVSQMGTASTKAGGLGSALKLMVTQLTGPLGVVFAITAVISAFDWLYGANEKVENSTDDLKNKFQELADVLREKVNVSITEYLSLMRKKVRIDKENEKKSESLSFLEESLNTIREKRIDLEKKQQLLINKGKPQNDFILYYKNQEKELEEQIAKKYKESTDALNKYRKAKDDLLAANEGTVDSFNKSISKLKKEQSALSENSDEWKSYLGRIEFYQKKIDEITGGKKKSSTSNKSSAKKFSPFKTKKELEIDIKDNEAAIIRPISKR